jgi:hypothetical protein
VIIEYQSSDFTFPEAAGATGDQWQTRISVNLSYVTTAQPYGPNAEWTLISIVSRPAPFVIKEDFDRFMRSWQAARR